MKTAHRENDSVNTSHNSFVNSLTQFDDESTYGEVEEELSQQHVPPVFISLETEFEIESAEYLKDKIRDQILFLEANFRPLNREIYRLENLILMVHNEGKNLEEDLLKATSAEEKEAIEEDLQFYASEYQRVVDLHRNGQYLLKTAINRHKHLRQLMVDGNLYEHENGELPHKNLIEEIDYFFEGTSTLEDIVDSLEYALDVRAEEAYNSSCQRATKATENKE